MRTIPKRLALLASIWGLAFGVAGAQHVPDNAAGAHSIFQPDSATVDSLRGLCRLTHGGDFDVFARTFSFSTVNAGELMDHTAIGFGMGLGYTSPEFARVGGWFGLRFALAGYFIFNLASTDLSFTDPKTAPAPNRYEVGLFDLLNPTNRHDLDRLEDLNLTLRFGKHSVSVGHMHLETPFLNGQDGRMRPTLVAAAWGRFRLANKLTAEGGWVNEVSPRSTVAWWRTGETIGLYPVGVGPDGRRSAYAGKVHTAGLGIAHLRWKPGSRWDTQLWHYWLENVFNLSFAQVEYTQPLATGQRLLLGAQGTYQTHSGQGGNENPELAYMNGTSRAWVASARARYHYKKHSVALNATRIGNDGRFLFPREWGRDPFYTFMPRERNEGFADVWAANVQLATQLYQGRLNLSAAYGRYWLPDVRNFARNKYGMPSYDQLNLLAGYQFKGWAQGLQVRLLYVYKGKQGETYGERRYVYQKVDMHLLNFIVDYRL